MRCSSLFRLVVAAGLHCATLAQNDAPNPETFLRRTKAAAAVIGDYVYIDGGEVSERGFMGYRSSNPMNSTLSIDISESWTSANVIVRENEKPDEVPRMLKQGVFTYPEKERLFLWGGMTPEGEEVPPTQLWKYKPDGFGGGDWVTKTPKNVEGFTDLFRTENGAYTSTNDTGFWIGGTSSSRSDHHPGGEIKGVLSFNFTEGTWRNDSNAPFSPDGTLYGATATYVPSFGENGVVTILGGLTRPNSEASGYLSFDEINFFDPVTRQWFFQRTTGPAPSYRYDHCAVGAFSEPGHFDIFVFGGRNDIYGEAYDDVHVLSMPGFVWRKASYPPTSPRTAHTCVLVGQRQILSIGGINSALGDLPSWEDPDPFPQGLAIFDMTEMTWSDRYDANASAYISPQIVNDWYQEIGMETVEWESSPVEVMFMPGASGNPADGDAQEGNDDDSGAPSPGIGPLDLSPGVIAGIAMGAACGLMGIGALAWFLFRRRQMQKQSNFVVNDIKWNKWNRSSSNSNTLIPISNEKRPSTQTNAEVETQSPYSELQVESNYAELQVDSNYAELPAAHLKSEQALEEERIRAHKQRNYYRTGFF